MKRSKRGTRRKLSTTISPETYTYLQSLVRDRRAENLAEAVDLAVLQLRMAENRARLERDTATYFENLTPEQAREEALLGDALSAMARGIDFDA